MQSDSATSGGFLSFATKAAEVRLARMNALVWINDDFIIGSYTIPGAFLIPYVLMLFVCGIPLFYMELAVGQYTRLGPFGAIGSLCPLLKVPRFDDILQLGFFFLLLPWRKVYGHLAIKLIY